MGKHSVVALVILASVGWLSAALAAGPELSAVRVQTLPDKRTLSSPIAISGQRMRTERTQDGQTYITIVDGQNQKAWHLDPAKKQYMEFSAPAGAAPGAPSPPVAKPALPDEPGSPCTQGNPNLKCNSLGREQVAGRDTDKWEFIFTPPPQQQAQEIRVLVWIDRELRLPLREEGPGGMVSELKDLKIGPQPAELFEVPAGYTRIEIPAQPTDGRTAPSEGR